MDARVLVGSVLLVAASVVDISAQETTGRPPPKVSGNAGNQTDTDKDGIPDAVERELLSRYTPYLRFSTDGGEEQYRPMDVLNYVRWSELQASGDEGKDIVLPNRLLATSPLGLLGNQAGTDLMKVRHFRGDRFLNPLGDVPAKDGNWARHGWAWTDSLRQRNVGLYGHVVPFTASSPQTDFLQPRDSVLSSIDPKGAAHKVYHKIEYWQFFGYNGVGKPAEFGDHEGDWTTVQLLVDAATRELVQVHHFFHGYRAGFDLRKYSQHSDTDGGRVREYHGPNFGRDVHFTWHEGSDADRENATSASLAQNNVVRLMRDPRSGEFTHPIVYVEHGGHEFWPTEAWSYQDSPKHGGDELQHSYLAATPPNLGEVENPLSETPEALLILRYNGRWGAFSRKNDPPQGPPLHNQWTWPAASSVRWLLPKDLGN